MVVPAGSSNVQLWSLKRMGLDVTFAKISHRDYGPLRVCSLPDTQVNVALISLSDEMKKKGTRARKPGEVRSDESSTLVRIKKCFNKTQHIDPTSFLQIIVDVAT
jgi:hypothetical protein